jgi:quercetin dioxygenase-like cupin family protein
MRFRGGSFLMAIPLIVGMDSCRAAPPGSPIMSQAVAVPPTPLVLALEDGERRNRRVQGAGLTAPFILKVDRRNGGSQDLVMGYEDIPPGQSIGAHRHLRADEIIFVHAGAGVVQLGNAETPFEAGATIYIPKNTRISLRNTGSSPVSIAFVFSKPGFEEYLRATSVAEGESVAPLAVEERRVIREQHKWHTVYETP